MTARAIFPALPHPAPPGLSSPRPHAAEAHLSAIALRLWQGGAVAQADVTAWLHAAFGARPGAAVAVALDRVSAALQDGIPRPGDRGAVPCAQVDADLEADSDSIGLLVAATLHATDADEMARLLALRLVPAHRMETLVIAARGLGLALRRAILAGNGPADGAAHCPARQR